MTSEFRKKIKNFLMRLNQWTLPSRFSNWNYNKKAWDRYARFWNSSWIHFEDENNYHKKCLLGTEWGNPQSVKQVVETFILPYITSDSCVGEIGSGGGRIATQVAPKVKKLICFDISSVMLQQARSALQPYKNVDYILLRSPRFPDSLLSTLDCIYAIDVFVHLDLHLIWRYFQAISSALKAGGHACLHTTNLRSPEGWKRFSQQQEYSVEGHYFISAEIISIFAEKAGLKIIKTSEPDPSNFYFNRDFLFILEKPFSKNINATLT